MTDKQFQKALDELSINHSKYLNSLQIAESEYVRRFGFHLSDVDDDFWIDTYHQAPGASTVAKVTEAALSCKISPTDNAETK